LNSEAGNSTAVSFNFGLRAFFAGLAVVLHAGAIPYYPFLISNLPLPKLQTSSSESIVFCHRFWRGD
jgi:hypothetical protein